MSEVKTDPIVAQWTITVVDPGERNDPYIEEQIDQLEALNINERLHAFMRNLIMDESHLKVCSVRVEDF